MKRQKSATCTKMFEHKHTYDKNYRKVKDTYRGKYRGAAHSIYNLKNSMLKGITITSHKGSNYDYDFIIKELGEEFKEKI